MSKDAPLSVLPFFSWPTCDVTSSCSFDYSMSHFRHWGNFGFSVFPQGASTHDQRLDPHSSWSTAAVFGSGKTQRQRGDVEKEDPSVTKVCDETPELMTQRTSSSVMSVCSCGHERLLSYMGDYVTSSFSSRTNQRCSVQHLVSVWLSCTKQQNQQLKPLIGKQEESQWVHFLSVAESRIFVLHFRKKSSHIHLTLRVYDGAAHSPPVLVCVPIKARGHMYTQRTNTPTDTG